MRRRGGKTAARIGLWLWAAWLLADGVVGVPVSVARASESDRDSAARRIRFGIQTGQEQATWTQVVEAWKVAEEAGFDSAWLFDHLMPISGEPDDSCLEAWTLLGGLATQTQRLRIGVLVSGNTYRNPALLAKMATTVDHMSQGRLTLGLGAGWFEAEHRAYGFPFGTAKERAERLEESLQVIQKLWSESRPSFRGVHYRLEEAPFAPKPVQRPHPPILVGGQGKKWTMPLVARYADAWNAPIGMTPSGLQERLNILRSECARLGRSPCEPEVSVFLPLVSITDIPLAGPATRLAARAKVPGKVAKNILAGSAEEIAGHIQNFVDAGATHVILYLRPPFDPELIRRFAKEVIPKVTHPRSVAVD